MRLFASYLNLSKTSKVMIASATVICLILLVLGLIVINLYYRFYDFRIEKNLPFITGIALGYVNTIIKIVMIEKSLKGIMNAEDKKKAKNIGLQQYMIRFVFTGVVLAFALLFPYIFGPVGTVLGIFSLQISALTANIFLMKSKTTKTTEITEINKTEKSENADGNKNGAD